MINLMIFSDRPIEISTASGSSRSSGKGLCLGARICDTGVRGNHWKMADWFGNTNECWSQGPISQIFMGSKGQVGQLAASWWLGIKLNEH